MGSGLPLASYPLEMDMGNTGLLTGPNLNAPSIALQGNHQIKYDGSRTLGRHLVRYGVNIVLQGR